jgi:two-component system, cell cycle response regulator
MRQAPFFLHRIACAQCLTEWIPDKPHSPTRPSHALYPAKDDLIELTQFLGKEDKLERYFTKLSADVKTTVQKLGEACFENAVIDATHVPLMQPARVAQFLVDTFKLASELGISVEIVGTPELPKAMSGFQETKDLHCFTSVEQARAKAA